MENVCRVLIVDDEYLMRQGIKFMIKKNTEKYEVVGEAANGREALEMIPELKPQIILCDIVMPVMDGLELIRTVKKEYPEIRTVALSGYDNEEYMQEALEGGASEYFLKPMLNPDRLAELLDKTAIF